MNEDIRPAAKAFDAIAETFDTRFAPWLSVAAQRRAIRAALLGQFPPGGRLLEIGGGTGEDAAFLARRGFEVLLTDPSPTMVRLASEKLADLGSTAELAAAEQLDDFAQDYLSRGLPRFDGAFSNFAPLNCVVDPRPAARGLARLLKPGSVAMLVVFGTFCPGEMIVETLRGRPGLALRRLKRGVVPARLARREFQVVYHRAAELERAFAPWFRLEKRLGIGVCVPPSSAEPWISGHPHMLSMFEALDRRLSSPLACLGDHVLYQFRRTGDRCYCDHGESFARHSPEDTHPAGTALDEAETTEEMLHAQKNCRD